MEIEAEELAATYSLCSLDDLATLAAEIENLTDGARTVLEAEIRRRGISTAQLQKLHSKELHRESRFDQLEKIRRRKTLLYLLPRNDPMGWIAAVLIVLVVAAIMWLRSLR